MNLNKPIEIRLLEEAEEYFLGLDEKVQVKFLSLFDRVEMGLRGEWFEKLANSDGIFEFRYRDKSKFYRILSFWDSTDQNTLVIACHGFDKKSNKTPPKEIKKAQEIRNQYFKSKKSSK